MSMSEENRLHFEESDGFWSSLYQILFTKIYDWRDMFRTPGLLKQY